MSIYELSVSSCWSFRTFPSNSFTIMIFTHVTCQTDLCASNRRIAELMHVCVFISIRSTKVAALKAYKP